MNKESLGKMSSDQLRHTADAFAGAAAIFAVWAMNLGDPAAPGLLKAGEFLMDCVDDADKELARRAKERTGDDQ